MRLISIYPNMTKFGGAQKILCDIHNGMSIFHEKHISSFDRYDNLDMKYNIRASEYIQFNLFNMSKINNSIILSHHRKTTTILYFLIKANIINSKLVHVAHNEFHNLKYFTFFPDTVIAVSERVKKNHVKYFSLDRKRISVIYNGIRDTKISTVQTKKNKDSNILILYPARVTDLKNQVHIVKILKTVMPANIKIIFAGEGDQLTDLKKVIAEDKRFEALGFVDDMENLFMNSDFVMLYSLKEGLPISLIEALMYEKPIICNDVGGNKELVKDKINGFIAYNDKNLIDIIANIVNIHHSQYARLCLESRQLYERKFRYEEMIHRYQELIKTLI